MNSKAPLESGLVKGVGFAARRFNRIKDDRSRPRQCFVFQSPLFCHGVYNHERALPLSLVLLYSPFCLPLGQFVRREGEGRGGEKGEVSLYEDSAASHLAAKAMMQRHLLLGVGMIIT